MGLLRRLAGRRVRKIDRARVDFFDLDGQDEVPIEAQAVHASGGWPQIARQLLPPSAFKIAFMSETEWVAFPFSSVLLLTSSHLRWCPHRTYDGRPVYTPYLDGVFGENAPTEKGFYTTFPNPLLGRRSVPVGTISRVSLDAYWPSRLALIHVHLTQHSQGLDAGQPGPIYDMAEYVARFASEPLTRWPDPEPDTPVLQFIVRGPAALNFATFMSSALDYLVIPFQMEELSAEERAAWNESTRSRPSGRPWRPLSQRLELG